MLHIILLLPYQIEKMLIYSNNNRYVYDAYLGLYYRRNFIDKIKN